MGGSLKFSSLIKTRWFKTAYHYPDVLGFTQFYAYKGESSKLFYKYPPLKTLYIDLSLDEKLLLSQYAKGTRYEIKRASKEDIHYKMINDDSMLPIFVNLYNEFASTINLKSITTEKLVKLGVVISSATYENRYLALHCYILDENKEVVRLLHSVSLFRSYNDPLLTKMCGWANRGLHHFDILYFKEMGFKYYDFGGIANNINLSQHMKSINNFKLSFGGNVVVDQHIASYPLIFLLKLTKLLK